MERSLNLGLRFGSVSLGLVVAGCICLCGLCVGAIVIGDFQDYRDSATWKKTQGEVLSAQVQESTNTDTDGRTSTTYRPFITYRYFVGDQEYLGDRLRFGGSIYTSDRSGAENTVRQYTPGTVIDVYYDPDNPEDAVVERDLSSGLVAFLAVAGVFLLCAVIVFVLLVFVAPFVLSRFTKSEPDVPIIT
jgi:hypothetical protein